MVRRVVSLLLTIALFSVTGQSAAYAARGPDPVQSTHMAMADCMKMMDQSASERADKPAKQKNCTLADCLNYMIACAGITVAVPDVTAARLVVYDRRAMQRPAPASPLHGRSLAPDIQPPIA